MAFSLDSIDMQLAKNTYPEIIHNNELKTFQAKFKVLFMLDFEENGKKYRAFRIDEPKPDGKKQSVLIFYIRSKAQCSLLKVFPNPAGFLPAYVAHDEMDSLETVEIATDIVHKYQISKNNVVLKPIPHEDEKGSKWTLPPNSKHLKSNDILKDGAWTEPSSK